MPSSVGDSRQSSEKVVPESGDQVQSQPSSPAKSQRSSVPPPAAVSSSHSTASSSSSSQGTTPTPIRQHSTASTASSTSASAVESASGSIVDSEYGTMSQIHVGNTSTYEVKALKPATDYLFRIQVRYRFFTNFVAVTKVNFFRLSIALDFLV